MNRLKLTQKELDEALPVQLLSSFNDQSNIWLIEQFKLKAMTTGVTEKEIVEIQLILENERNN